MQEETIIQSNITSEMGQQTNQAKEVYLLPQSA